MTTSLPLMKNVLTPLVKIVLVHLRLTKATSATDAATQKKNSVSETALVFSYEYFNDIMKIVKSRCFVDKTVKNEVKEQKENF